MLNTKPIKKELNNSDNNIYLENMFKQREEKLREKGDNNNNNNNNINNNYNSESSHKNYAEYSRKLSSRSILGGDLNNNDNNDYNNDYNNDNNNNDNNNDALITNRIEKKNIFHESNNFVGGTNIIPIVIDDVEPKISNILPNRVEWNNDNNSYTIYFNSEIECVITNNDIIKNMIDNNNNYIKKYIYTLSFNPVLEVNELQDSIIVTYSRFPLVTKYSVTKEEIYKIEYSRYDGTKKIIE
jgi:hypothetical protein